MRWKDIAVSDDQTIQETLRVIDEGAMQIALVVDREGRLQGTVTDGDIRRGILEGVDLDNPIWSVMNKDPVTASRERDRESLVNMMKSRGIRQIPLVDKTGCVVGIEVLKNLLESDERPNTVVIMAGGLGTRLRPLTKDCPKPLLELGNQPILETILEGLIADGFNRFYISVNYMAEMIKDYFRDGSEWGVDIAYLHEESRLGTAGPLSLLPERPDETMIVMNGDILTKLNYIHLLDFHYEHGAAATICVREHQTQVPYGVVETEEQCVVGIEEKPIETYFVNGGIYVLEPETLKYVPEDEFYDMPDLFNRMVDQDRSVSAFPVREYWQDIGRRKDFRRVDGEYKDVFE